jgi:hypothetical protein
VRRRQGACTNRFGSTPDAVRSFGRPIRGLRKDETARLARFASPRLPRSSGDPTASGSISIRQNKIHSERGNVRRPAFPKGRAPESLFRPIRADGTGRTEAVDAEDARVSPDHPERLQSNATGVVADEDKPFFALSSRNHPGRHSPPYNDAAPPPTSSSRASRGYDRGANQHPMEFRFGRARDFDVQPDGRPSISDDAVPEANGSPTTGSAVGWKPPQSIPSARG